MKKPSPAFIYKLLIYLLQIKTPLGCQGVKSATEQYLIVSSNPPAKRALQETELTQKRQIYSHVHKTNNHHDWRVENPAEFISH